MYYIALLYIENVRVSGQMRYCPDKMSSRCLDKCNWHFLKVSVSTGIPTSSSNIVVVVVICCCFLLPLTSVGESTSCSNGVCSVSDPWY